MRSTTLERARMIARANADLARINLVGAAEAWADMGGTSVMSEILRTAVDAYRAATSRWMRVGRAYAAALSREQAAAIAAAEREAAEQ
jgi:hypothetical protein